MLTMIMMMMVMMMLLIVLLLTATTMMMKIMDFSLIILFSCKHFAGAWWKRFGVDCRRQFD
jgi:hypothetical protein